MLERLKLLIGVTDELLDTKLNEIILFSTSLILLEINETELPVLFEPIVINIAVARYNQLGSEGISAETIDVISTTYSKDYLEPYKDMIKMYNATKGSSKKVVFV